MSDVVVWRESLNVNYGGYTWHDFVYGIDGVPVLSPTADCGLMQTNEIHSWRYEALGYTFEEGCIIPEVNLQVSRWIYDDQGADAWTTYR